MARRRRFVDLDRHGAAGGADRHSGPQVRRSGHFSELLGFVTPTTIPAYVRTRSGCTSITRTTWNESGDQTGDAKMALELPVHPDDVGYGAVKAADDKFVESLDDYRRLQHGYIAERLWCDRRWQKVFKDEEDDAEAR